ncbi:MAG: hypothetical protein HY040_19790 [Planctomycetes bacterium]|nr:hypothetical protein [Planctomycetota bacterium]
MPGTASHEGNQPGISSDPVLAPLRRGPVQATLTSSTDLLVSGDRFSIIVTVRNPFEIPITLKQVTAFLPTEFVSLDTTSVGFGSGVVDKLREFMTLAGFPQEGTEQFSAKAVARISSSDNAGTDKVLQPGNSTTFLFTARTRRNLWFTPSTYRFNIDIQYRVGAGDWNTDSIPTTIQVRASLISVGTGAAVGAMVGWFVRKIAQGETLDWGWPAFARLLMNLLGLAATMLLAVMGVLFVARKKDTQPFISVEDVWGGMVIGFMVGYQGSSVIGIPNQN